MAMLNFGGVNNLNALSALKALSSTDTDPIYPSRIGALTVWGLSVSKSPDVAVEGFSVLQFCRHLELRL